MTPKNIRQVGVSWLGLIRYLLKNMKIMIVGQVLQHLKIISNLNPKRTHLAAEANFQNTLIAPTFEEFKRNPLCSTGKMGHRSEASHTKVEGMVRINPHQAAKRGK